MWTRVALLCSLLLVAYGEETLKGYHMIETSTLESLAHVSVVKDIVRLHETDGKVKLIQDEALRLHTADLVVAPDMVEEIVDILRFSGLKATVLDSDLESTYEQSRLENQRLRAQYYKEAARKNYDGPNQYLHTFYRSSAEINTFLSQAASGSSGASIFSLGNSYEGRATNGIQIVTGSGRPYIWVDAGIHAREWIAPATAMWMIDEILSGTGSDAVYMRNNYNFYIAPQVNPDGYDYSMSASSRRMWRKNRRPAGSCVGTDCNRNFDFNWRLHGTSTNPCADTYGGASVFSEVESTNVRDAVMSRRSNIAMYISLHSYSQLWLVPWAGDLAKPSDYSNLKRLGDLAGAAVQAVNGRRFVVGTPPDILYAASGGMYDWAKDKAGITVAYTPELRPASQFEGGFDIPASNIIPSGREIFAGITAIARAM